MKKRRFKAPSRKNYAGVGVPAKLSFITHCSLFVLVGE